jgi:LysM repeat protein
MDTDTTPRSGASAMVPVAIGLVGVVIGAIALIVSLNKASSSKLDDTNAALATASDTANKALTLAQAEDAKVRSLNDNLAGFQASVEGNLTAIIGAVNDHTKQLEALQKPVAKASGGAKGETSTATRGAGGVHIVEAGDTFGKIATKYGVSVKAIEDANPSLDSSHLRIGAKVVIPASSGSSKSAPAPTSSEPPAASPPPTATAQ